MHTADIFCVPVGTRYLLYAPLHGLTALINRQALQALRDHARHQSPVAPALAGLVDRLAQPPQHEPAARTGPVTAPLFLGIIPTRGCNMACHYCDFYAPKTASPIMSRDTARRAVDAYFDLIAGQTWGEVHFFGGEPFFADEVVHFVVAYANYRAAESGLHLRFEATTNGLYNPRRCQWIADNFDTVVLSLDGPPDIQDRHRPGAGGRSLAPIVNRNARMLSDGPVELVIRTCITGETVHRMPEIAAWIVGEFRPSTVCFEVLSLAHTAEDVTFTVPDPVAFARNFMAASCLLAAHGIDTATSTATLSQPRLTFCPVGQDALIVAPDGTVDACYLLPKDWQARGLDMRLGTLEDARLALDPAAVQRARALNVNTRPLCADCFCRYTCAGGCHVNHDTSAPAGQYDDTCIQTRIITAARLLQAIGQDALADTWLHDRAALETTVWQANDRLLALEPAL